jgi:peroxiredoxin
VLLISFSSRGFARAWSEEVCSAFRLLLDRERATYGAYGLESSISRSWSLKVIKSYVQLMRGGREWRGIQGNSAQLGGDFIIDAHSVVRLAYRSRDPTDRPSIQQLLAVLRQLGGTE